jgi:hypothetical protein
MLPSLIPVILADPNANKLEITTAVPVDDQFSSPKQIRWSSALGKLLVANSNTAPVHIRNYDLSFASKKARSSGTLYAVFGVDTDLINLYWTHANNLFRSTLSIDGGMETTPTLTITGIRMIDASGDPLHIYVTSNNATDGHGVRKVRKSDMTVVASILATGAGDGQFNGPLGIKYHVDAGDGIAYLYVADVSNVRTVKLKASDLSFVANISAACTDLDTDGTNWFLVTTSNVKKYDMSFTDATKITVNIDAYSLCIIPDQGDGYGQTLAITDSTNSHLERRKCSDLSAINSVGSAGDGSTSLFDPTFTTSVPTQIEYKFDDGFSYVTPLGTTHALSWNGFAGYSFRSAGPHRCTVTVRGGLGLVTGIDCNTDAIISIRNIGKILNCITYNMYEINGKLVLDLNVLNARATTIAPDYHLGVTGDCARFTLAEVLSPQYCVVTADLAAISRHLTYLKLNGCGSGITGSLSDLPSTLSTACYLYSCTGITPGSIAHLIAIRDLRIYSMWPTLSAAESVDIVINSMWTARAAYTYAAPSLQIGGTNPAPSGNKVAPVEGSDWHEDVPGHWVPLTANAMVYDLLNDVNSEGFKKWFSIATS